MKKNNFIWMIAAIILGIVLITAVLYIFYQQKTVGELTEQFDIEKEELQNEYGQLALQYEGYQLSVGNDSLVDLLDQQQAKVQQLLEELRVVKASNARRFNELKKELETVRSVMKVYIRQIDSLNQINQQLTAENKEIRGKYREATQTVSTLTKEKDMLAEKITIAAKLDAVSVAVTPLNARGRKEKKVAKTQKLQITFTVLKNVTAPTGDKEIYARISTPDDQLLTRGGGSFLYEGKNIPYSIKRTVEYKGEDIPVTMYWDIDEYLFAGTYRLDLFADGYRIGGASFGLEK